MRRMSVSTTATAKAFQAASLLLVGAAALLVLAHAMMHAGAPQAVSTYIQAR